MNKNITPHNKNGQSHGLWECYHHGGKLLVKAFYLNGKRIGYTEYYGESSKIQSKVFFLR